MKCMFPTLSELTTDTEYVIPILRVTPSHEGFYYNVDNRNEVHYVSILKQKMLTLLMGIFLKCVADAPPFLRACRT